MSNIYHILYRRPITCRYEMPRFLESLVQQWVHSGRIRIDVDSKINFVKLNLPRMNKILTFSYRELHDKHLAKKTKVHLYNILRNVYSKTQAMQRTDRYISSMKKQLQKYQFVHSELEMKLIRVLVQSSHPAVILNMLIDRVEVFISCSHNIGDLLDISQWQQQRGNSGMQSIDNNVSAVFISCGGDPFGDWDGIVTYGDGMPALAQMMVIAGQEIGHYADLDKHSPQLNRYSFSYHPALRADMRVQNARLRDMDNLQVIQHMLHNIAMFDDLGEIERSIAFYTKVKQKFMRRSMLKFWRKVKFTLFLIHIGNSDLDFICDYKYADNAITLIKMALSDMKYNLEPTASAYRNAHPDIETAILCAEALARVPQQVNKWGKIVTHALIPNLYQIYYSVVIPDAIMYYEITTGEKYDELNDYRPCGGNLMEFGRHYYKKIYNFIMRKNQQKMPYILQA